jgi:hypothetical protein
MIAVQYWHMKRGFAFRDLNGRVGFVVAACILALAALYWGETTGRASGKALAEWIASVSDRGTGPLDPADEGRLVRVFGTPAFNQPLMDHQTGITFDAIAVVRLVETFERYTVDPGKQNARVEEGWGRSGRLVIQRDGGFVIEANPKPPFDTADIGHQAARIGSVPVTPELAFVLRNIMPLAQDDAQRETVLSALRARFPGRSIALDGDWYLIAASPDRTTIGDMRVRFTAYPARALSTVVGRQRDGRLDHASDSGVGLGALPGQQPVAEFAPRAMQNAAGDAVFWSRFWALFVLAIGMMVLYLGWKNSGTKAPWWVGAGAFFAADDGPVGVVVAIFMAILLVPFAIAALPFTVALGALAWWMAHSTAATVIGAAGAAALAALVLYLTQRRDRPSA